MNLLILGLLGLTFILLLMWQIYRGIRTGEILVWWQGREHRPSLRCNRTAQPQVFWLTVAGHGIMASFVCWFVSLWVIGDLVWNKTAPTITAVQTSDDGVLLMWDPPQLFDKPDEYLVHRVETSSGKSEQIGTAEAVEDRFAIPDANDATSSLFLVEARYSGLAKWIVGDRSTVSEPATVSE